MINSHTDQVTIPLGNLTQDADTTTFHLCDNNSQSHLLGLEHGDGRDQVVVRHRASVVAQVRVVNHFFGDVFGDGHFELLRVA